MIELDIAVKFRERIKETELWQKYNVIMTQKAKDSNVILKWYYIHLVHFSDEEDGSASVENEKIQKIRKRKTLQQESKILVKNQQVFCRANCQH